MHHVLLSRGSLATVIITKRTQLAVQNMTCQGKLSEQATTLISVTGPDWAYENVFDGGEL